MIFIPESQISSVSKILNEAFPEGYVNTHNKKRNCFTLTSAFYKTKLIKVDKYIDVFYRAGEDLIRDILVINQEHWSKYEFIYHYLCSESHKTLRDGWLHRGRKTDYLSYREYTSTGEVYEEYYIDWESSGKYYHNPKGHAILQQNYYGTVYKQYYLNGNFIGENLPVGDDPETYLKNYTLL